MLNSFKGVHYPMLENLVVADPGMMEPVPADGEIMFRGSVVMKGYLKNPQATKEVFKGGENISSIEIEKTLYRHSAVIEAAVVSMPNQKWGEIPCAFVTLWNNSDQVSKQDTSSLMLNHDGRSWFPD